MRGVSREAAKGIASGRGYCGIRARGEAQAQGGEATPTRGETQEGEGTHTAVCQAYKYARQKGEGGGDGEERGCYGDGGEEGEGAEENGDGCGCRRELGGGWRGETVCFLCFLQSVTDGLERECHNPDASIVTEEVLTEPTDSLLRKPAEY